MRERRPPTCSGALRHSRCDGGELSATLRVRRGTSLRSGMRRVTLRRGLLRVYSASSGKGGTGSSVEWSVRVAECEGGVFVRRGGLVLLDAKGRAVVWFGGERGVLEGWKERLVEAWGCRLERFYVVERSGQRRDGLIGKGHYADVMQAVDRTTGELVAVKAIEKCFGGELQVGKGGTDRVVSEWMGKEGKEGRRGRKGKKEKEKAGAKKGQTATKNHVAREAEILRCVDHPNVVRCIDQFETSKVLYVVLELAPHGTLGDILDQAPAMSEDAARDVAQQLLLALQYLHEQGIVHRDIKPENVLLGAGGDLKVTDFGLSRFLHDPDAGPNDYSLRSVLGTPSFCAPEVVRKQPYGAPVDCWAAGVILHLSLTGRFPFRASSPSDVFLALRSRDRIPFPKSRWACVSPAARDLVRKLLAFDPDERLTAMEALHHPWMLNAASNEEVKDGRRLKSRGKKHIPTSSSFSPVASAVPLRDRQFAHSISMRNGGNTEQNPSAQHASPLVRNLAMAQDGRTNNRPAFPTSASARYAGNPAGEFPSCPVLENLPNEPQQTSQKAQPPVFAKIPSLMDVEGSGEGDPLGMISNSTVTSSASGNPVESQLQTPPPPMLDVEPRIRDRVLAWGGARRVQSFSPQL